MGMFFSQFDMDTELQVVREESYDEGWTTGVEAGIERGREEGREEGITEGIEKGRAEGIQRGIERGAYSKAIETAKRCLAMKMLPDMIAELTGLTKEEIAKIDLGGE